MKIEIGECEVNLTGVFPAIKRAFVSMPVLRKEVSLFQVTSKASTEISGELFCVVYAQDGCVYKRKVATYLVTRGGGPKNRPDLEFCARRVLSPQKTKVKVLDEEWNAVCNMVSGWDMPELHHAFHGQRYYHGLAAYQLDGRTLTERASDALENEVSASTRPIGTIGLIVKGRVLCFSNVDLFSEVVGGRRVFNKIDKRAEGICYVPSEVTKMWDHDEAIMIPETIQGIFYKEYANDQVLEEARCLAKQYNVPLVCVEEDEYSISFSPIDLYVTREMWEKEREEVWDEEKWYESDYYMDYHIKNG